MSPAERRRLILGDDVIEHIHQLVDAAPEPSPEVVEKLRRIMTRPAGAIPEPKRNRCCKTENVTGGESSA